jgi:hypothetical protein
MQAGIDRPGEILNVRILDHIVMLAGDVAAGGDGAGAREVLPLWLMALGSCLTVGMALSSGLAAWRSLRLVEPITLLR